MREINKIIIHCSASDNPKHDNVKTITEWHQARGFRTIGYHYFIRANGGIQLGRAAYMQGAHCKNHNKDSLGICLHGLDNFTPKQMDTLDSLIEYLCFKYGVIPTDVYAHNHFNKGKTCPNFKVKKYSRNFRHTVIGKIESLIKRERRR